MPTIRELRVNKGLSQQALASKAGVAIGTVNRMEAGNPVSALAFHAVCAALDVSPDTVTGVVIANRVKRSV